MPSVDVSLLLTGLNPIRHISSYTMPVLSPSRRTSSTSLTGSYRSTFSSSSINDRPSYYGSSNSYTTPRISSYSERYTTRTYSTADDSKKVYGRHSSISEDSLAARYREDSREKSIRRDSLTRDSSYSNSLRDSSLARDRELSLTRSDSSRERNSLSTLSMIDSVADLRNKYSPASYVPAVYRKQHDHIARSKSINDIGRPPIERTGDIGRPPIERTADLKSSIKSKKVIENGVCNGVALTNNTNDDKLDNTGLESSDNNGNRASVAEIRKKFDPNYTTQKYPSPPPAQPPLANAAATVNGGLYIEGTSITAIKQQQQHSQLDTRNNKLTKIIDLNDGVVKTNNHTTNELSTTNATPAPSLVGGDKRERMLHKTSESDIHNISSSCSSSSATLLVGGSKFYGRPAKCFKTNDLDTQDSELLGKHTNADVETTAAAAAKPNENGREQESTKMDVSEGPKPYNHTTNFASYIPVKDFTATDDDQPMNQSEDSEMESNENSTQISYQQQRIVNANNDISTSPRLNRASISQNSSGGQSSTSNNISSIGTTQRSSPSPNSRDDDHRNYDRFGASSVKKQGLNGLKNIGNTCFMNSVIQCLSNTKYLLEYVREDGYLEDINTTISSMKGALIKAFSQVIQELWSPDSSDRVVNTVALKSQIQRFAPRFMGYAQQDAQEFLRYLLEGLHEDVNRVTAKPTPILTEIDEKLSDAQKAAESWQRYLRMDNSCVVDIFVGQLKSTLRCTHCGHCSVTFDPFWDLSLPIPQRQGPLRLTQCLEHFTREETMDGDEKPTCSKCKERRKCTKSFSIQKFPKILVIHLKRFSPTERFRGKLNVVIDFPLQGLDLSSYAANKNQTECSYNLYAISNHSGTTYSGHYTAYCKHPYNGQWHEYNDSRVSSISPKNVVSSEAYVLFYELVGPHAHL